MDAEIEIIEARLKSFLGQLQSELGVLDRIVHKNRNQHRRSSYFQYLVKVRRDFKLLQSTNLEEIVNSSFIVINGNRPKQKVQLLESLKGRKCDGGKHNFLVRLLGAARLLSQMVNPMLKAAICVIFASLLLILNLLGFSSSFVHESWRKLHVFGPLSLKSSDREISTLLARSFFMGFSMAVLALLARLRVLAQQILIDVVSVFNMVSSLSQKQQSIKLTQEGIEVFREYYPTNQQAVFLECVWKTDRFVLLERTCEPENKTPEIVKDGVLSQGLSTVKYQSIETLLGDIGSPEVPADRTSEEKPANTMADNLSSLEGLTSDCKRAEDHSDVKDGSEPSSKVVIAEDELVMSSSAHPNPPRPKSELKKKVAFISVKRSEPSTGNDTLLPTQPTGRHSSYKEDSFFSLLGGSQKDSFF